MDVLTTLEQAKTGYGAGHADAKLALLRDVAQARLRSARQVVRLHEALVFLRAYPDDARVLQQVEEMLAGFTRRRDFRQHRAVLADTGLAGTAIRYRFFWPTACWLAWRWPDRLRLDRRDDDAEEKIGAALHLLAPGVDAVSLRETGLPGFAALDRLRAPAETDAAFFLRRLEAMPGDTFTREAFHDTIDATYLLEPGPTTPSRTHARDSTAPVRFQTESIHRVRPDLRQELRRPPEAVRLLSRAAGRPLVELARGAMVTRARDLDAFAYGDPGDVRVVEDDGGSLRFAAIGMVPERRALLATTYGLLTLRNGVPIGYVQVDALGPSVAISFNTFDTYRGGEAAFVFARALAAARHLFGAGSFSIEPYQLGHGNEEGLASGAWWFYYKLGFRPRVPAARRLALREVRRSRAHPGHRFSERTLRQLARWHLFFDLEPNRTRGLPPTAEVALRAARIQARRAGTDGEQALGDAEREAMRLCGIRSPAGLTAGERLAWKRWSPLVIGLPGVARWSRAERRALGEIVSAKGGRRESDFAARFLAHPRLGRALLGERGRRTR
jgi:hypothetical protein